MKKQLSGERARSQSELRRRQSVELQHPRDEVGQRSADHVEDPAHVDRDRTLQFPGRRIGDRPCVQEPGVVHDDVETAEVTSRANDCIVGLPGLARLSAREDWVAWRVSR